MTFSILLQKYLNDELRPDELNDFLDALSLPEHREMLVRALDERLQGAPSVPLISNDATQELFRGAMHKADALPDTPVRSKRLSAYRAAFTRAAVLILVTATATWYFWP